jgi:hypothetical protein
MTVSTVASISRAIVQTLRLGHGPKSLLNEDGSRALPSKWLHEGFAPELTPYPFITWQPFPTTPRVYTWGSVMALARYDIRAVSRNSVEAENLDALCSAVLDEANLSVEGQSTLICRRVADLRSQDVDEEGQKVYMIGGTYEVWTDQPLPSAMTSSFTMDAVIV